MCQITYLCLDGVTTLLTEIHEIEDASFQMRHGSDTLHLDRVHLFQRVVEDARRVDDLPA